MPLVSVIIPSFNHARYIRECIDSVFCQTFKDFEVIVVDDGSSDESLDILRSFGNRIRLIEQSNRGTQAARNRGLQLAKGKYIALLDSDDGWLPNKLEVQIDALSRQPEIGLLYSFCHTINADGSRRKKEWHYGKPIDHPNGALAQLLQECFIPALTVVFRRQCIDEVGYFDEELLGSGDWDMWIRIAAKYPIACVNEPLALYRLHTTNTIKMLFQTKAILTEYEYVLQKAFLLPEVNSLPQKVHNQAWARFHLESAKVEAIGGNARGVGRELKRAVALDPLLLEDEDEFANLLIHLAHLFAERSHLANPYKRFVSESFLELSPILPSAVHLRRAVLADSVMGSVFEAYQMGDLEKVKSLILTGVYSDPKWLGNLGVWSIMADTYLGRNTTSVIRRVNNKLRDFIV
jgi:hypothetical protein